MTDLPPIAIPSYQRAHILLSHTLGYLADQEYPAEKITIFVASEKECEDYKKVLPVGSYGALVVGRLGLLNQLRFISEYYPEGELVLKMDDDVKGMKILMANQTFLDLIRWGCWLILTKGGGLFGVLQNDDLRRFSEDLTTHLTHIIGCFYLHKNDRDCVPIVEEKDDYERSILFFKKYGKVYRWNGAGLTTKYMGMPGGLQQEGRKERMKDSVEYLLKKYPDYCRYREKKGTDDLILNWRAKSS